MDMWQWKHRPRKDENVDKDDEHFLIPRAYFHTALILILMFIIVRKLIQRFLPNFWGWLLLGHRQPLNLVELLVCTIFICFINMMVFYQTLYFMNELMMSMKGDEQILHRVYPRD